MNDSPIRERNREEELEQERLFKDSPQKESPVKEQQQEKASKPPIQSENITLFKFVIFILYAVSILVCIYMRINFPLHYSLNQTISQYFLNELPSTTPLTVVNSSRVGFSNVTDRSSLINFLSTTIIYAVYQDDAGNIPSDNDTVAVQYENISPLRILQKRASLIYQPEDLNFPTRWNLDKSLEDTTTYSSYPFSYNPAQGGFNLTLEIPFDNYSVVMNVFNSAVNAGYFDYQTRDVQIDFAEYNNLNSIVVYFRILFTFCPTGMAEGTSTIVLLPAHYYRGETGRTLIAFQVIFTGLLLYYLFQEFMKMKSQVRNIYYMNKGPPQNLQTKILNKRSNSLRNQAKDFKNRTHAVVIGLRNHFKDPWSLLDLASLACCLADWIIWIIILKENTIGHVLNQTSELNPIPLEARRPLYHGFNDSISDLADKQLMLRKVWAINILIILFKMLKYSTSLNSRIMDHVYILLKTVRRIIPFLILLCTILLAYVYLVFFQFGNTIKEFSNFFTAFRYFFTNIHNNFSQSESIMADNATLGIIFHILFIFMIVFILINMFVVFVTHGYKDYLAAKNLKENRKEKGNPYKFRPHYVWYLKNFYKIELPLLFQRMFKHKVYKEQKKALREKDRHDQHELLSYANFNFDLKVEDTSQEAEKLNPIFNSEASIRRTKKETKIRNVKHIWSTVGVIVFFIILIFVCGAHQKTSEAQTFFQAIKNLLNLSSKKVLLSNDTIATYNYSVSVQTLQRYSDITGWMEELFSKYYKRSTETLRSGEQLDVNFLTGDLFLITDMFRLTLRKRSVLPLKSNDYHGVNSDTLSPLFSVTAKNPSGEYKEPITGPVTGRVYTYSEGDGYYNTGGYVITTKVDDFADMIEDIKQDQLLDSSMNSLVLDFALYHINSKDMLKPAIIFQETPGSLISTLIDANFVGLQYYDSAGEYILAMIEIVTVIGTFLAAYRLYKELRKSNYHYNYWYSLYIANFPPLLQEQREKKKPEIVRKLRYMLGFNNIINIFLIGLLLASAFIWIYYIGTIGKTRNMAKSYLTGHPTATNSELLTNLDSHFHTLFGLRATEGFIFLCLSAKIVYFCFYFPKFHFLSHVLKKSAGWIFPLLIIMVLIIMGFGFFLQMMRGTSDQNYTSIAPILAKQLQGLNQLNTQDRNVFTQENAIFISIIYYMPWVIIGSCILYNMFLGISMDAFQEMKEKKEKLDENAGFVEFWFLTVEILRRKRGSGQQDQRAHFEINDKNKNYFNYVKVFEEFGGVVTLAPSYKDMTIWATGCTKNILMEHTTRKTMKNISKEIIKSSVIDFDFERHEHKKILTRSEKYSQFALRMKYWNYFKYGHAALLEFMNIFHERMEANEKELGDVQTRVNKMKVDEKIKKYILQLESSVSNNLRDVKEMSQKVKDYEVLKAEKEQPKRRMTILGI